MLSGQQQDDNNPQLKTTTMLNNELGSLDISGGFSKDHQRGLRNTKEDRNKQVLALNKKLIKPLTGSKQSANQS